MATLQKVLVVDDSEMNRMVLEAQLESLGYQPVMANDGIDALAVLEHTSVVAVISDILMPRMDGYRLCHEIRRHAQLKNLPLIVYTGTYVSEGDKKLAHRSGADRYILKPAPIAVLKQALSELLSARFQPARFTAVPDDKVVMREYNAVLIQKLEEKTTELEAKNAELAAVNAKLEESRARAAGILASAMDAIITVDYDRRIVLFNRAAEEMFRVSADKMMARTLDVLLPHYTDVALGAEALDAGGIDRWTNELRARSAILGVRSDGEEFPVEASLSRSKVAGREFLTVIIRDITERRRAEREVQTATEQMRALALRLENIREEERTRIAREIHDVLAQELTRLKIDLVWLAKRAANPIDESIRSTVAERIKGGIAQTDVAISTVQRIATELRPVILDSLGLSAAVEWQAEDFARRTGISCHAAAAPMEPKLGRDRATALFRILQESLTNVARHAQASVVDIQLMQSETEIALIVRDNGRGISEGELADPKSIGLAGMRERAQAFGGTVEIANAGAGGTVVSVRLPRETSGNAIPIS